MGYRYQDATGRVQLAKDIHVLQQALKSGRLSADSMVLDESVKIRLKAAALIAFKARESAQARGSAPPSGNRGASGQARPAPGMRPAPERNAPPVQDKPARSNRAAWVLGLSLAGMLVLSFISLQFILTEPSSGSRAATETTNTQEDQAADANSRKSDASAKDGGSGNGETAKQPLAREDLLKSVLPLMRKSHEEMMQNNARYHREIEHLNLGQSMAPEVLLSREGLARNAIRFQSFNGTLDRYAQAEDVRMRRLIEDVHRAIDNRFGGSVFVKEFEEGLVRSRKDQDDFIRTQRELGRLFQQVTEFMLVRHGDISLRGGSLTFRTEADAATYRQLLKDLDRLAREESMLQGRMLETMTRMGDLLDEWSR